MGFICSHKFSDKCNNKFSDNYNKCKNSLKSELFI